MKKVTLTFLLSAFFFVALSAQESKAVFTVELSTDSILMGNFFTVRFHLENAKGDQFEAPNFKDFRILSGPNVSSSLSIVNGESSQSITYTYRLQPKEIGNYYIEPASIAVDNAVLETMPVEVMVVPNPDGIIQEQQPDHLNNFEFNWGDFGDFNFSFPENPFKDFKELQPQETPTKKKRKTYKL